MPRLSKETGGPPAEPSPRELPREPPPARTDTKARLREQCAAGTLSALERAVGFILARAPRALGGAYSRSITAFAMGWPSGVLSQMFVCTAPGSTAEEEGDDRSQPS